MIGINSYFLIVFLSSAVLGQFYEDKRCRCVCATPFSIINKRIKSVYRNIYIAYVPPSKCKLYEYCHDILGARATTLYNIQRTWNKKSTNFVIYRYAQCPVTVTYVLISNCVDVILPLLSDEKRDNAKVFCPRCECKYETRNTTIIMVVVFIVLWILMVLAAYFIFLVVLDPLVTNRRVYFNNLSMAYATTDEAQNPLMQNEDPEE